MMIMVFLEFGNQRMISMLLSVKQETRYVLLGSSQCREEFEI